MRMRRRATELGPEAFGTPTLRDLAELLSSVLEPIDGVDVLATTQVDFDPCWSMLALRTPGGMSILCNPKVRSTSGESYELGACASFVCVPERTICPVTVVVGYRSLDGRLREVGCGASGSRAIWQGIDSLNGKLFLDRMDIVTKARFLKNVRRKRMTGVG